MRLYLTAEGKNAWWVMWQVTGFSPSAPGFPVLYYFISSPYSFIQPSTTDAIISAIASIVL